MFFTGVVVLPIVLAAPVVVVVVAAVAAAAIRCSECRPTLRSPNSAIDRQ